MNGYKKDLLMNENKADWTTGIFKNTANESDTKQKNKEK
jgi:hypothetical protein